MGSKQAAPPSTLTLTPTSLEVGEKAITVTDASLKDASEALEAAAGETLQVRVEPEVTGPTLVTLLRAARAAEKQLAFVDVSGEGNALSLTTHGAVGPGEKTAPCSETSVVIGKLAAFVSRAPASVSPSGGRDFQAADPSQGILAFIDDQTENCLRIHGQPAVLGKTTALVDGIETLPAQPDACPHLRVATHPKFEWREFAPLLRQIAESGRTLALVDADPFSFASCGGLGFREGNIRRMEIDSLSKKGSLTEYELDEVLEHGADMTDVCLADDPPESTDPTAENCPKHPVDVEVGTDGTVAKAVAQDENDPVARCAAKAIAQLKFPEPRVAQPVVFTARYAQHF